VENEQRVPSLERLMAEEARDLGHRKLLVLPLRPTP